MYRSFRAAHLILSLSLAAVFLWFGIDKFLHPGYWIQAWLPAWFGIFLSLIRLDPAEFIFLNGAFEVLIGLSLLSGVLNRFFSLLGAVFLILIILSVGFNEITFRDIGLMGGLLALSAWPDKNYIFR